MSIQLSIEEIRYYILGDILKTPDAALADEEDLLLSGLLDSLSVMKLVTHIEEQAGIVIPPEDLLPEHFGTLNAINSYLQSREN